MTGLQHSPVAEADPAEQLRDDPSVDEIAAALRKEPVLVTPPFGNGHTEQVRGELRELVDQADQPVYVVMVPTTAVEGDGAAEELATLLRTRVGDGAYLVRTNPKSYELAIDAEAWNESGGGSQIEREFAPDGGANAGVSPAGVTARTLDIMVHGDEFDQDDWDSYRTEEVWASPPTFDAAGPEESLPYPLTLSAVFVAVTVIVYLLVRTATTWRRSAPPEPERARLADAAELRQQVVAEMDRIRDRLAEAASLGLDRRGRVDGGYDAARRLLGRTGTSPDDLGDLAGALVLIRAAENALTTSAVYEPCYFDPRHGAARTERRIPVGGERLEVPVCEACRTGTPEPYLVPGHGGPVPYYETSSVWARTGYGAFGGDLWRELGEVDS